LNPDDYVSLTSFTHHPFYSEFAIEIQDNWRNGNSWNLPIDELMTIIDNAIEKGFTLAWASDVSEQGFTRNGIAVVPDIDSPDLTGSDMVRWIGMTPEDKRKELTLKPSPEQEITQEIRQTAFNNWETTDDHGMHIYGIAKDQTGKEYYMVKNSWGTKNKYQGTWYVSKSFVKYKTINILVHKKALPADIAKKINL
jgi:aminopeptidase C